MDMELDRPCECEKRDRDENCSDIGDWKTKFGLGFSVIFLSEVDVDLVDSGNDEPDCGEETEARPYIHKSDLNSRKAVLAAVDRFELGIKTVRCGEDKSLVTCHGEDCCGVSLIQKILEERSSKQTSQKLVLLTQSLCVRATYR